MNFLIDAQKKRYAVAHFNFINMETLKAVSDAARELRAPVMVATSESAIKYCGYPLIVNMFRAVKKEHNICAILHADHIKDISIAKNCIKYGWDSVMIDGSGYNFQKNVNLTRKVVKLAKKKNILVEGEIGQLKESAKTDPREADDFVRLTKIDSLAIAIGTSHGAYKFKGKPKLDIELLKEIRELVSVPLVLHGASGIYPSVISKLKRYGVNLKDAKGVPDRDIKRAIKNGICKINVNTDLRLAFLAGVREFLSKNKKDIYLRDYLGYAREKTKEMAKKKIILFGSRGKCTM